MEGEIVVRYLHFLGLIGIASTLTAEHLLIKKQMLRSELKRIAIIDLIYGISAILMVVAGLMLWLSVGKPAELYSKNWIFHTKFTLVIIMSICSFPPTFFFYKNSKGDPNESVILPKRIKILLRIQLTLLLLIPILAVLMARGIGNFG